MQVQSSEFDSDEEADSTDSVATWTVYRTPLGPVQPTQWPTSVRSKVVSSLGLSTMTLEEKIQRLDNPSRESRIEMRKCYSCINNKVIRFYYHPNSGAAK